MFRLSKIIIVGFCAFCSFQTKAVNIYGSINGTKPPVWDTAVPVSVLGGLAPSYWEVVEPRATSEWYPGSLKGDELNYLVFRDLETGNSFSTPVIWKGVQYNMGSSAYKFSSSFGHNIANGMGGTCRFSSINIPISSVSQSNGLCGSDAGFRTAGERITPFKFFRPVFELPDLSVDIQGKPSGRYSASFEYKPVYFYKSESDVLTYNIDSKFGTITIDYTAAFFSDARKVSGDGIIEPVYDKSNQRISGSTTYVIQVEGLFPDGVKMSFQDVEYNLKSTDSQSSIPYSISCSVGCGSIDIVSEGALDSSIGNGQVSTLSNNQSEGVINIHLDIDYIVDAEDVTSGEYKGLFDVKFEADL